MTEDSVIAGISEKNWDSVVTRVAQAAGVVGWVHIVVADGTMGTDVTVTDMSKFADLVADFPQVSFEVHLLSATPEKYIRPLADAGVARLIAHVECNDPRRFLTEVKYDEVEVGMAIDGATEIEEVEPFLEEIDFVVIMSAEAGVTGGTFLPEAVEKVKLIRQNLPDLPIEVVGGITDVTVKALKDVGATRVVSTAFLYQNPGGMAEAVEALDAAS